MFIDRKLECRILACATTSTKGFVHIFDAWAVVKKKRPDMQEDKFLEHIKRLCELEYIDCPECVSEATVRQQLSVADAIQYTVTQSGKEYLQAMVDSDLFEFEEKIDCI
ncbi:hypothetical protein [Halodesulfovibrio sp.]|jgi:hypothetical protein|uniref:hypothetical protein n=1 Tax=Halodesulfovibrio sp. TaxID=1912772 RepID=UPI0025DF02E1|nr:hypothetical protein [Halodesulfovibrio sp.]MCT4534765.1 hypothetical protein [Halodesulfovibrio sp.]